VATDLEILSVVKEAFGRCKRPVHFTNWTHCCECGQHDETLRSKSVETIGLRELGNPGWDPLCFISPEGFKYYLPALARLALSSSETAWYGKQLLFHLNYQGAENRHFLACSEEQKRAVETLLVHIAETRSELVDKWLAIDD
jgi:hypothetical protein